MLLAQGMKNSMPPLSRRRALSYNDRMNKNDWFPKNPWFSADIPEGGRFRFKWKLPLAFAALALLLFAFFPAIARIYTDFLWYRAEGFLSVWLRDILYSWATFAFVFTVTFLFLTSQWGGARRHMGRSSPGTIAEHFAGPQIRTVVLLAALFFSFSWGGPSGNNGKSCYPRLSARRSARPIRYSGWTRAFSSSRFPRYRRLQGGFWRSPCCR